MSAFTEAFTDLYGAQTEATGAAYVATVTGFANSKPAIVTELDAETVLLLGGTGEKGGLELMMLISDFSSEPTKFSAVSVAMGLAAAQTFVLIKDVKINNGVYYLTCGDIAANS